MKKELLPIKSNNLSGAQYDSDRKTLIVKFASGKEYEYSGVPNEVWQEFESTFQTDVSSGKFLNQHIKKYPYKAL